MFLVKNEYYLIPADDVDKDEFNRISQGEIVQCKLDRGRNVQHHRKYFLLINYIFDNMPEQMHELCPTKTALRKCLQKLAGHTVEYRLPNGTVQVESDTINFSLPQKEFEEVYNRVIDAAFKYFITDEETQKQFYDMI